MNLYVINNPFWFELENLTRLYFPNEKINVIKEEEQPQKPFIRAELSDKITVSAEFGACCEERSCDMGPDRNENELRTVRLLYKILEKGCGVSQPWGLLTGVRPIKLLRKLSAEQGAESAGRRFTEDFFVSPQKLALAAETEQNERRIISLSAENSFSLYVGVPFCPSRCSYCSFVMASVERAQKLIEPYVERLCEEIKATAEEAARYGLRLESVYFGGGTPTTLSAGQLERVIGTVYSSFDMSTCREFTVEAGRPDTFTAERLFAMKENGVDRISINPQTVNDGVLAAIGRRHTAAQFYKAFELARRAGFDNINTDLIAGLPSDSTDSFSRSLDEMLRLGAECVTVHTLCMKRASNLTQDGAMLNREDAMTAGEMLSYAESRLKALGYIPYYLYRQTRMVGNLENVGWAKPGRECLYNVYVMDETHTILACGSGGVTKLRDPRSDYLRRIFNFKYPYEYIGRFDEVLKRKSAIGEFYRQLNS